MLIFSKQHNASNRSAHIKLLLLLPLLPLLLHLLLLELPSPSCLTNIPQDMNTNHRVNTCLAAALLNFFAYDKGA